FLDDGGDDDGALASSVGESNRAVGLRLKSAVVLVAHHLDKISATCVAEGLKDALVFAMTGEVTASAEEAVQTVKEMFKRSTIVDYDNNANYYRYRYKTEEVAKSLPRVMDGKRKDFTEILVVGRDWDEQQGDFVPCLSYANQSKHFDPPDTCCTGIGSMYSQSILDMEFRFDMSKDVAVDIALRAIYFAAIFGKVKGQAVEAVDVCVVTAETIHIKHYDVEYLHETYGPLVEERKEAIRKNGELRRKAEQLRRSRPSIHPPRTTIDDLVVSQ
ncbi:hypothetical protein MKX03_021937, partial [Papaver bracteatum]